MATVEIELDTLKQLVAAAIDYDTRLPYGQVPYDVVPLLSEDWLMELLGDEPPSIDVERADLADKLSHIIRQAHLMAHSYGHEVGAGMVRDYLEREASEQIVGGE